MTSCAELDAGPPLRLLVGDGRAVMREALARALQREECVLVARTVAAAAEVGATLTGIDVALFEVDLPGGVTMATRMARERVPSTPVVLYDVPPESVTELARVGATGFADPSATLQQLLAVVRGVTRGDLSCTPQLAGFLEGGGHARFASAGGLTEREREVLGFVAAGLSNDTLAQRLGRSEHTVRSHLRSAMRKLGARNRVEAVAALMRWEARHREGP